MLLVSSPHIHCGHTRTQKPLPTGFQCEETPAKPALQRSHATDTTGASSSHSGISKKYYYYPPNIRREQSSAEAKSVVRMEDYTIVDCVRHGGNNALIADSITRALVVMCDGHGSLSMLGQTHINEVQLGGAEMARLAAHSLANELYLENASLTDAFRQTSKLLLRYSFEGAARHSLLRQSLIDGTYFQWLASLESNRTNNINRDTVVSKTCELRANDFAPTTRYVTQSGERIDPLYGTTATVVECGSDSIRVCNIGDTLVALFSPCDPVPPHKASNAQNVGRFKHAWLTESHSVSNPDEVKRMRQKNNIRAESGRFMYKVPGGTNIDADSVPVDREVCRLSRSLGHQCLRAQGMLNKPSAVLVQQFVAGQIAVVATAGVWNALAESREADRLRNSVSNFQMPENSTRDENYAAKTIGQLLSDERSRDPNVLADIILVAALDKAGLQADNMSVVVLAML